MLLMAEEQVLGFSRRDDLKQSMTNIASECRSANKGGGGEIARCLASARKGDRACNIDPPASSYAIMRRAGPYRGENSGPGKDDRGELDTETRN
jgi:hypothetical protein